MRGRAGGARLGRGPVALLALALALVLGALVPAPLAAAPSPQVAAPQAIVLDPDTGQILFARDIRARVAPASLTKVMTALVAIEHTDLATPIAVDPADLIGEASMGLRAGEVVSLETLLYGLLLPSGNDAAMAIARGVGERAGGARGPAAVAQFVAWMNETAARLGLADTHFANPHGLDDDGHLSSAHDLARLTGIAWRDPLFARIFGSARYQGEGHVLAHGHRLIGNFAGVVGGKTGLTDGCGFCLITAAEHGAHRLVVVVLRDTVAGAFADTTALLTWGYAQIDAGLVAAAAPPVPAPAPTAPAPSAAPPTAVPTVATPRAAHPPPVAAATTGGLRLAPPPESSLERLRPYLVAALALGLACGLVRLVRA